MCFLNNIFFEGDTAKYVATGDMSRLIL